MFTPFSHRSPASSIIFAVTIAFAARLAHADDAAPVALYNPTKAAMVTYNPLTPAAKPGDFVFLNAAAAHPTQVCLGYREVALRARDFSAFSADVTSKDPKSSIYPFLAKKDVPIIIAPDGTPYITDGHHTLAGLLASSQKDKRAFGHVVANFYHQPEATFVAFMTDPKNNDTYLYGPDGNSLTIAPRPLSFSALPHFLTGVDPTTRMADDPYRSLTWAMKNNAYLEDKNAKETAEDPALENFIEFRWADLFRNKIIWNDKSDASFFIAVANADALAHSESTTDITRGFSAKDRPGFLPAKAGDVFTLNITNETYIFGDISPSALSANALAINADADSALVIPGRLENFSTVTINAGGSAEPSIEQGKVASAVKIPQGTGTVVLVADSPYQGATVIHAGKCIVNGSIAQSKVTLDADAILTGSGRVGTIAGPGLVSPGASVGMLTASAIDPSGATCFAFEFTTTQPDFAHPLHSKNDLLHLTAANPLVSLFTGKNRVNIYLNVSTLHDGDTFTGGLLVDAPNLPASAIASADFHYFIAQSGGPETLRGNPEVHYAPVNPTQFTITPALIAGPNGSTVTAFTVSEKKSN